MELIGVGKGVLVAIDIGMKLPELGQRLYDVIERAKGTRVEVMVVLYLQVAQAALIALGRERQRILSEATGCDLQDRAQVDAVSERMRVYLQEDNVRAPFQKAIEGLRGCRQEIERATQGLKWRKADKQQAVQAFLCALHDLDHEAQALVNNFFPEFSGQGLGTLAPIHDLLKRISNDLRRDHASDVHADEEIMADLIRDALRDPAQSEWIAKAAKVERLIVEIQLTFSIKQGPMPGKP
jgi:hypothetical protein